MQSYNFAIQALADMLWSKRRDKNVSDGQWSELKAAYELLTNKAPDNVIHVQFPDRKYVSDNVSIVTKLKAADAVLGDNTDIMFPEYEIPGHAFTLDDVIRIAEQLHVPPELLIDDAPNFIENLKFAIGTVTPGTGLAESHDNRKLIWSSETDTSPDAVMRYRMENPDFYRNVPTRDIEQFILDENEQQLDDEKQNLDRPLPAGHQLIVIGRLGLWNGEVLMHTVLGTQNLNAFLTMHDHDDTEFYAQDKDVFCRKAHHDGRNVYMFRSVDITTPGFATFMKALSDMELPSVPHDAEFDRKLSDLINVHTDSIYPDVADVYGWQ